MNRSIIWLVSAFVVKLLTVPTKVNAFQK
jgi:hypothetical protein